MNKILSVCIASYNMEEYLPRCVESMLGAGVNEELEIIIVNDGSTDRTLEIADSYKAKYPDTVVVIDKENGHYGSCINASLKVAKGKFFRIVDADDWVDSDGLRKFVEVLKNNDADCFVTNYIVHIANSSNHFLRNLKSPEWYKVLNVDNLEIMDLPTKMHSITWRLQLLKDIEYTQTEGIHYSDVEYVLLPKIYAKTIYFTDIVLYQYFSGRKGQSVSPAVRAKSISHHEKMMQRFKTIPIDEEKCNSHAVQLKEMAVNDRIGSVFFTHIFLNYNDKEEDACLREELAKLLSEGKRYEDFCDNVSARFNYIRLWYEGGLMNSMILACRRYVELNKDTYICLKPIFIKLGIIKG